MNHLSGSELVKLERLAQMVTQYDGELFALGLHDSEIRIKLMTAATPFLAERAFKDAS